MCVVGSATAMALAAGLATAQPVGLGWGPGIAFVSEHDAVPGTNLFEINPSTPFFFDPGAGAWEKRLNAPLGGFQPDQIYTVREWITFLPPPTGVPNRPLADWHEEIALGTDGQIWDVWTRALRNPVISLDPDGGNPLPGLEFDISPDGLNLWFDFDPIDVPPNGLTLHIEKDFRFVGNEPSFEPVVITQYPTPAPGGLALLGLAGVLGARRRRG